MGANETAVKSRYFQNAHGVGDRLGSDEAICLAGFRVPEGKPASRSAYAHCLAIARATSWRLVIRQNLNWVTCALSGRF